jgi:hypothetical protein
MRLPAFVADRRPLRRSMIALCQVVRERDFRLVGRRVLDVSEDGLLVETDLPVLTGEAILVSFQLPFARSWIDAEATVMRVVHGRRKADRRRGLGLWFERIDATARLALKNELGWFGAARAQIRPSETIRS